ncbi:hypothetical protein GGS26DRAFT_555382 [Hypomontagnella submonticulosa]|nr:hypothetical protein GGS26DRAFT_555382 [Hypomontagnella submonticulosa]
MPLLKSFSEQNGSSRTRQHWNKTRSHSAVNYSNTTRTTRNPAAKPLQPISEATRNKLNAFKRSDTTKQSDQDPVAPAINLDAQSKDDSGSKACIENRNSEQNLEKTADSSAPKGNTTTPMNRLVWQDLIGTVEVTQEEEETSPNERIGWDSREDPRQGMKMSPVMPGRRGKKRARSSSPVSSSPASNSKPRTPAVNVEKLSRAIKSHHADPTLELWDRYSHTGTTSVTPVGAMNSALAQIMVSSPRSLKKDGGGLRRTISCGANWPKRRRVERTEISRPIEVAVNESPRGHSKSSMVNALLESVTGEINKTKAIQARRDALRSPSPKKKRSQLAAQAPSSPTRQKSSKPAPPLFTEKAGPIARTTTSSLNDSSDYGDDEFDDDTLMELDASICQSRELIEDDSTAPPAGTTQIPNQQYNQEPAPLDDEFADIDDDDVFAAAEDLISQIDSSRSAKNETRTPSEPAVAAQTRPPVVVDDLGDDVFGDDFGGDFDFEAAEIAATQSASVKQVNGIQPPVRRQAVGTNRI